MKIFILIFFLFASVCYADIYMQKDATGNVTYTDVPSENSVPLIKSGSTLKKAEPATETKKPDIIIPVEIKKPYTTFLIASPKDQETIHNNPNITVSFNLVPALQAGDVIQVLVDGNPAGEPQANSTIAIGRLDRGIHQFSAVIYDKNKQIVKQSNSITVYIHYAHLGTSENKPKSVLTVRPGSF